MQNNLAILIAVLFLFSACANEPPKTNEAENAETPLTENATNSTAQEQANTSLAAAESASSPNAEVTSETVSTEKPVTENTSTESTQPMPPSTQEVDATKDETVPTGVEKTTTNNTSSKTSTSTKAPSPTPEKSTTTKTTEQPKAPAFSHAPFDELLRKYVNAQGNVNYVGFKQNKTKLEAYLASAQNNPPQSSWSKNKIMAYWINVYNAFTIKLIVANYPVKSIMDIDGGKVWDKQKITIGGRSYTLNQIEKDNLLKRYGEERVHFAVNCAAASCPPLLNKAWTEDNIQRYLEQQAKAFINNSSYNELAAKRIKISQIFNWYASDFGGKSNLINYLQKYANTSIKNNAKVEFKTYDWSLNKQ